VCRPLLLCVKRDYLVDATVLIQKCSDVRFYLCAAMKNVLIEGAKDATFVLGAVSGITKVLDCTNCTFIVATRVLHAANLIDCKFNLATPMGPILNGSHVNTELAPFNTKYDDIDKDTHRAGIMNLPNNWQTPFVISEPGEQTSWRLQRVRDFFYYCVPYELSDNIDLSKFHFPIPLAYKEEVARKIHAKKKWKATLKTESADMPEKSALMRKLVKLEFNKWLAETGHEREINQLQSQQ